MFDWLNRYRFFAGLTIIVLAVAWLYLLAPLYRESHIAQIERVRQEVEQIRGEQAHKEQQLNLLRDTTDGHIALHIQHDIGQLDIKISNENRKVTPGHILSLLTIILGVVMELLLAAGIAYLIYRYIFKPCLVDWLKSAQVNEMKDLDAHLKDLDDRPQKDAIAKVLAGANPILWPQAKDWKKYLEGFTQGRRRSRRGLLQESPNWARLSTVLFNTAKLAKDSQQETKQEIKEQYLRIGKILFLDTLIQATQKTIPLLVLLISYIAIDSLVWWIPISGDLKVKLHAFSWPSLPYLLGGWSATLIFSYLLQSATRYFTDKSMTDLDDIIVGIVNTPIIAMGFTLSIIFMYYALPTYFQYMLSEAWRIVTANGISLVITTIVLTYFAVMMFNRVLMLALERWSARTKQNYDDLLVQILKIFGSFFIAAVAGALLLINFQTEIEQVTSIDNLLLPYTIVVSVLTAIIGYSTQEGIQNFFGGLLLQIEKPFDLGDRIVLDTGEICDVRFLGIRATGFYNVLENTEISMPNRIVANQKVTNLSRPNLELRMPLDINISLGKDGDSLEKAEYLLLDLAYSEPEIDRAWVSEAQIRTRAHFFGRQPLSKHIETLRNRYDLEHIYVEQASEKEGQTIGVLESLIDELKKLEKWQLSYSSSSSSQKGRRPTQKRYDAMQKIAEIFGHIEEYVYAIGEVNPDARISDEYLDLIDELSKKPSVHSRYGITEEGCIYLGLTLRVYAIHLERRFEVAHKINKKIQLCFSREGIKMPSI